ncbi:MAG: alpha/beta hydrolase [Pseudomonadales bacterium]
MSFWPGAPSPRATLLIVHGGCWSNEYDLTHTSGLASALAVAGCDVWSLEYRRVGDPGGGWPGSLNDVQRAVQTVAERGAVRPMLVMGHSAGGHLALLLGALDERDGMDLDAIIGLAPIAQLTRYGTGSNSCQQMVPRFMGGKAEHLADDYLAADPAYLQPHSRTFLLSGDLDSLVPSEFSALDGVPLVQVAGAGHFDWLHPQTAAFDKLSQVIAGIVDGS